MARLPRFVLPGHPQHVIQRGNNKDIIFCTEEDYRFYLDTLSGACERFGASVHSYVLMTNHVHLLITPHAEGSLSRVMQSLGRKYVQYFNYQYKRSGTLWEGRYKATIMDTDAYLLTCYRYIELNPVRAGMVLAPGEYPWSSYRANALGAADEVVTPHALYLQLGEGEQSRQSAYRALFRNHLSEGDLAGIREATNKAWALGSEKFRERIEQLIARRAAPVARGGDRKSSEYQAKSGLAAP